MNFSVDLGRSRVWETYRTLLLCAAPFLPTPASPSPLPCAACDVLRAARAELPRAAVLRFPALLGRRGSEGLVRTHCFELPVIETPSTLCAQGM